MCPPQSIPFSHHHFPEGTDYGGGGPLPAEAVSSVENFVIASSSGGCNMKGNTMVSDNNLIGWLLSAAVPMSISRHRRRKLNMSE